MPWEIIQLRTPIRVDDLYRVSNPGQILNNVENPIASVAEHQEKVGLNKEERKEGANKNDVANMMTMESIATGVPFYFQITLDEHVTDAQIGLMLLSLSDLFEENAFGGWVRCGFGKVHVQQMVVSSDEDPNSTPWTGLYDDSGKFQLPLGAQPYVDQACEQIQSLSIDSLSGYFVDFSADKKLKAKEKLKADKSAPKDL